MAYGEMTPLTFGLFINWAYIQMLINSCSVRAVFKLFNLRWELEIEYKRKF
jgi:phosphatidylserine/phosphatidylglycerophosphate/cardiolipin synthase-like enzyme